jgi:hypothetical protein
VSRGQRGGSPAVVNLSFLERNRYFSFKVAGTVSIIIIIIIIIVVVVVVSSSAPRAVAVAICGDLT